MNNRSQNNNNIQTSQVDTQQNQTITLLDLIENDIQTEPGQIIVIDSPEQTIITDDPEQTILIDDPVQKLEKKRKREEELREAKDILKTSSDPEVRESANQKIAELSKERKLAQEEARRRKKKDKKRFEEERLTKTQKDELAKKRVKINAKIAANAAAKNGYLQSMHLAEKSDLYKKEFEKARGEKEKAMTQETRDTHSGKRAGKEHAKLKLPLPKDLEEKSKAYKDAFNLAFASFNREKYDYKTGYSSGRRTANLGYANHFADDKNSITDKSEAYVRGYNAGYAKTRVKVTPPCIAYNRGREAAYEDVKLGKERTIFDNIKDPIVSQHLDEYIKGYKKCFKKKSFTPAEHDFKKGYKAGRHAARHCLNKRTDFKDATAEYKNGYNTGYDKGFKKIPEEKRIRNIGKKTGRSHMEQGLPKRTEFKNPESHEYIKDSTIQKHIDEYIKGYNDGYDKKIKKRTKKSQNSVTSQSTHIIYTQTQTTVSSEIVDYSQTQTTASSETESRNENLPLMKNTERSDSSLLASQGLFAAPDKDLTTIDDPENMRSQNSTKKC